MERLSSNIIINDSWSLEAIPKLYEFLSFRTFLLKYIFENRKLFGDKMRIISGEAVALAGYM